MPKIPWEKIRQKIETHSETVWKAEESELRRIVDAIKEADDKIVVVAFSHTIDCSKDVPAIKSKISFSEKFSYSVSGDVDDPAQMTLEESEKKKEKEKD